MTNLVFVYGTLKKSYGNSDFLQNTKFVGPAKTIEPMYLFAYGIPVVSDFCYNNDYEIDPLPINGEVYTVTKRQMAWLDALEGHPDAYKRTITQVKLKTGEEIEAWIYKMDDAFGSYNPNDEDSDIRVVDSAYTWEPNYYNIFIR